MLFWMLFTRGDECTRRSNSASSTEENFYGNFYNRSMKFKIPLELIELEECNYHITVSCRFANGREGLWIIDTGASKTVFDEALRDLYDLVESDEEIKIQSAGIGEGKLETSLGQLHGFSFSNFTMETLNVALIDLSHINKLYYHVAAREICGLIGSDFLLGHKAVIDYRKMLLILEVKA